MRPIEQIKDPVQLKKVALLLQKENEILAKGIAQINRQLAEIKSKEQQLILSHVAQLEQRLAKLNQLNFGDSSERRPCTKGGQDSDKQPQSGHGPRAQAQLPIEDRIHVLPVEELECDQCGFAREEWAGQFEDSEEITLEPRSFKIVRHRRQKYRCQCTTGAICTAPGPLKLIPGGRYSIDFATDVSVGKHADHLPLERQSRIMAREGLEVSSQTLWDQIEALATHLWPTYLALIAFISRQNVVHADETWWRLMSRGSTKRWWAWCLATPDAVAYRILNSRSQKAAAEILRDFTGTIVVDGYSVYRALSRAGPNIELAHCWAHVRRKFVDAAQFFPKEGEEILNLIGKLYEIESQLTTRAFSKSPASRDEVRVVRDLQSREVIEEIRQWALAQRGSPESALRKAIHYMFGLWDGLQVFLDNPDVPLDNNAVERAIRGPVLGRKNHYGSRSKRGTEVAALFYSLIESAKLNGLDPKEYLAAAARKAITDPGAVLLPHEFRAQIQTRRSPAQPSSI